jgi:hypothetical protein
LPVVENEIPVVDRFFLPPKYVEGPFLLLLHAVVVAEHRRSSSRRRRATASSDSDDGEQKHPVRFHNEPGSIHATGRGGKVGSRCDDDDG